MKIALFQNLPDGGALRTVYEQVKGLSKKHIIDCYCFEYPTYKNISEYFNKIYTFEFNIDSNKSGLTKRLSEDYKNFIILRRFHKDIAKKIDSGSFNIALIHPDKWTESPFLLRYLKTNNIYFCHELLRIAYEKYLQTYSNLTFFKNKYEKYTRVIRKDIDLSNARSAQKILTASNFMANKIQNAYKTKAKVVDLGVDASIFSNKSSIRKNYVLFIGKKSMVKGFDTYKSLRVVLKKEKLNWVELAVHDKDSLRVTNDVELAKVYSNALCFLCLSREEPLGLTALESMACETPVLAVNEGGYRETVLDGVTGYLLPRDPKVFAEKIRFLMNNPEIARKMGKAGREHIKKNFTWKKHCKKLEDILLKVCQEKEDLN